MLNSNQQQPAVQVNVPIDVFLKCYHHLVPSQLLVNEKGELISKVDELAPEPDIDFLWGGRDSGKTRHIAMRLLIDCLTLPYFRCVLVRKVFNTIHDSQWQQLKDVAQEWGIDHLFTFKESPLEVICINGNKFICRGMDDPGKLKSISNPSHCWIEEGNQLEQDDFIIIMTSLRYNQGRVKIWFSFNPEADGDYNEFWLYKIFFSKTKNIYGVFKSSWSHILPATSPVGQYSKAREIKFTYRCTWTTYRHNRYVRPERIVILENMAALDRYYQTVFTNGMWGNKEVKSPFCYAFNRAKHVGKTKINQYLETIVSFDFNVDPITCGIYQHDDNGNVYVIETIKLSNSNIYVLCEHVKVKYSNYVLMITGDATGRNTTALTKDNLNYYKVIKTELDLMDAQVKVPSINPKVSENRVLVNACLHKLNIVMDETNCKDLIFDCENVSTNDVGDIDKGSRTNPVKRADHLDHFRYYLNTFHKYILTRQNN